MNGKNMAQSALLAAGLMIMIAAGGCSTAGMENPLYPDIYRPTGAANITFTDLDASCTIEITTLAGETVRRIEETDGDGQAVWDLKNTAGDTVAAGMYLYVVRSGDEERKGRLLISK
jgi:hypothetical protein